MQSNRFQLKTWKTFLLNKETRRYYDFALFILTVSLLFLAFDFANEWGEWENKKIQDLFYGQIPEIVVCNFQLTKTPMLIFVSTRKKNTSNILFWNMAVCTTMKHICTSFNLARVCMSALTDEKAIIKIIYPFSFILFFTPPPTPHPSSSEKQILTKSKS